MKKVCQNCQTEVSEDSKFCTSCGTQLENGAESPVVAAKEESAATAGGTSTNDYAEQGKELAKNYWQHLVHIVKSPMRHGKAEGEGNFVNGLITLVLFSLFIPLTIYFGIRAIASSTFGMGSAVPFGTMFFKPFFFILLFVAVAVGIIFAVVKPSVADLHIKSVVGRFGAFMVIPTAIMLLSLLIVSLKMFSVFFYVFFLGFIGLFIAATFAIYSFVHNKDKGIDGFYGVLLFYFGSFLFLKIVSENLFINQFLNEMLYF
ncbi:zinc-ribbon domain-containing protein [Allobacillus sp. GCM10007491]|uniref:Zinc ribbon domain-containing protein n=1 Tax=Allobacillus saliphilus TaxID=2912308 RepID=A0A941CU75_9BACI|nr:zinc ribbon domain-containing protein [Allobacillus saliphilus]MBR7552646.1 zinc ribbon domain-containing protein [Allobacillus saliphilus]